MCACIYIYIYIYIYIGFVCEQFVGKLFLKCKGSFGCREVRNYFRSLMCH